MADFEQDVFDAGASEAPPPDLAPSEPAASQDTEAVSSAITALRGPVPNYGSQPQPLQPTAPQRPPNPDDEPVRAGVLRDLLNERAHRQRLEASLREIQARENERQRQTKQPKTEDLLFSDPEAFKAQLTQEYRREIGQVRLESDMQLAAMRHGQVFDAAWQHFYQTCDGGKDAVSYFRVMNARSPGEEMVKWFRERAIMHQTGGDLNTYRQRVVTELLQDPAFLSHVQQVLGGGMPPPSPAPTGRGADGRFTQQPQPRHEVRLPTSLARTNGSGGTNFGDPEDGSEEAIFDAGRARPRH